jgi:putative PIN family toxin of toxin-antitoxin system
MWAILDTNVLLSAFLMNGIPAQILDQASSAFRLVISKPIIDELIDVLNRPKIQRYGVTETNVKYFILRLQRISSYFSDFASMSIFEPDPKDTHLLALAKTSRADYLVTGDHALQKLGIYETAKIVSPREFLSILEA